MKSFFTLLQLAIRLSALLEQADLFVILKKLECKLYIDNNDIANAISLLSDLKDMCPNDPEIKHFEDLLIG